MNRGFEVDLLLVGQPSLGGACVALLPVRDHQIVGDNIDGRTHEPKGLLNLGKRGGKPV